MPGVLPDPPSGGLIIRDAAGNCTPQPNVLNAYCPPASFTSTCAITALPSDCTARITAAQINAIVSELMSFAACMNPTGNWDCASVNNLCTAFTAWFATLNVSGITISDTAPAAPAHEDLWYESDTGNTYIYYDDGNTAQWVQIAPGSGSGGTGGISDAPVDGLMYARRNAAWQTFTPGIPLGGTPGQALVVNAANVPTWGAPIDGGTY